MGHVDVNGVTVGLPDGRELLPEVSFRVGDGATVALVGANGAGKTTLLRIVAGDVAPSAGSVSRSGGVGVMRQFVGSVRDSSTVRNLLVSVAAPGVRSAADELERAELAMMERDDEPTQLRYAQALADWGDAEGYDTEVLWDSCTVAALGLPYERARWRDVRTLSGGEQKRLVLEALLRGPDEVCCSTSRTTSSTCRASAGWRRPCGRLPRPCCSSPTTGNCSRGRRPASSRSRAAARGCTVVASRPITRRGGIGTRDWTSCCGGGRRSTRS